MCIRDRFHVEHQLAPDGEKEDCVGKWVVCNPENLKDFSAVDVYKRQILQCIFERGEIFYW